ncbi:MAG TPA: hypothetical protein VF688_07535, partial [Allosphingosinicella sp.]
APGLDAFLNLEEKAQLVALARSDFVENLEGSIEAETDAYESGWEPEEWFMYMRGTVDALTRLFPHDDEIADIVEEAHETIRERVRDLQRRIDEEAEEEEETGDGGSAVGTAATASAARSIFDDLTERV